MQEGQVLQDYHHTAWTIKNGLSAVWAVQQAPNGFLWVTTPTGVFRFDGLRFESIDDVTNREVHNADVVTVFLSSSGGVWLTTRTHGLLLWKDNRADAEAFTVNQGLSSSVAPALLIDREGTVWIGTTSGLDQLRRNVFSTVAMPTTTDHQFAIAAGDDGSVWAGNSCRQTLHTPIGSACSGNWLPRSLTS